MLEPPRDRDLLIGVERVGQAGGFVDRREYGFQLTHWDLLRSGLSHCCYPLQGTVVVIGKRSGAARWAPVSKSRGLFDKRFFALTFMTKNHKCQCRRMTKPSKYAASSMP